jgi:hypothetical protein
MQAMKLFSYQSAKKNKASFKSMTSLTVKEFEDLCVVFQECWNEHTKEHDKIPSKGGCPPILKTAEDRLFFILFYFKTYPLQEILAYSFEMSQSEANKLIHVLSYVLKMALQKTGSMPPRLPDEMLDKLKAEEPQDFAMDGTEREIIRPSDIQVQRFFYSGKSKCHTIKNNIIAGVDDRQIKDLSGTYEGKKNDKKICDEEKPSLPDGSNCYDDTGFLGYEMKGVNILQPKKKPRGGELTLEEKEENRLISSVRIVIEHVISGVKRCRIVKDIFRNTKADYDDMVIEISCALHNFRSYNRRQAY